MRVRTTGMAGMRGKARTKSIFGTELYAEGSYGRLAIGSFEDHADWAMGVGSI